MWDRPPPRDSASRAACRLSRLSNAGSSLEAPATSSSGRIGCWRLSRVWNCGATVGLQWPKRPRKDRPMRSITEIVAVGVLVLLACGGRSDGDVSQQTDSGDKQWGPLAVFPPAQGHGQARAPGTLQVTHECVVLEQQGKTVFLAWPADRTGWDPEARTVTFENIQGRRSRSVAVTKSCWAAADRTSTRTASPTRSTSQDESGSHRPNRPA